VELQPGTRVTINDFVTINGQVVFAKDEQVVIEGVSPNPERPEYKYVVTSTRMGSRFQLRDADVSPLVLSPTPVPPVGPAQVTSPPRPVPPQTRKTSAPPSGLPPKKDRKVLAIVLSVLAILIVIGVIAGAAGTKNKATTPSTDTNVETPATPSETPAPTTTEPAPTPAPAPAPVNSPTMSMAEFNAIQNGMTYEQVVQIVGGPGEKMSESGSPGQEYYTVMYMWEGDGGMGANANCMFQGGALMNKAQFGLE
jgi:hypothetical protein